MLIETQQHVSLSTNVINSINHNIVEVKSLFVLSLSKQFGSTSEGKLPDDFLDIMNNLDLQMNQIIIEEEVDKTQIGKNHAVKIYSCLVLKLSEGSEKEAKTS